MGVIREKARGEDNKKRRMREIGRKNKLMIYFTASHTIKLIYIFLVSKPLKRSDHVGI